MECAALHFGFGPYGTPCRLNATAAIAHKDIGGRDALYEVMPEKWRRDPIPDAFEK